MKITRLICFFFWVAAPLSMQAQDSLDTNATTYTVETFASAATGSYTPFWITSNRYGVVPLDAGNGYLRPSLSHHQSFGKGFHWAAGIDAVVSAPRYRNVYLQQLYAEIGYKSLLFSLGSKEQYTSLWDKRLSSGNMIQSANARPIPEAHISIPEFLNVPFTKGWFHFRGYMSVGRSFDNAYLDDFVQTDQTYNRDVLWHDKSLTIRLKDTRKDFPLHLSFGISHSAQWGGTSTDPDLGKQPQSFKDFVRIFCAKAGDQDASIRDKINTLGSHHMSYDFHIGFVKADWELQAYYQHLTSDKSGILMYNKNDGLWGLQLDLNRSTLVKRVVVEYITTRHQSGPFHYLNFDHDAHPGRGGGADNYYNNDEYQTGHSYFNRSKGSPLLLSPEYNTDGSIGFNNTRIQDIHLGVEGALNPQFSYRVLLTLMNSWGTPYRPFLKKHSGASFLLEARYTHPHLRDWSFTGSLAGDTGNAVGNRCYGLSLSISKRGLLKKWD